MSWSWLIPSSGVNTSQNLYNTGVGQQAQSDIAGLSQYNLGGQNLGQFQNLTQAGINNPWANMYQQGAGTAGYMGQMAGLGQYGAGAGLMAQGQGFAPDVQSLLSMGFDPQQALYARTAQQVADQQQAALAQSGVGGTPYGAGVAGKTASDFNIDWQNQQLQRAATGAGAAGGLAQTGAGLQQAGAGLENQGISSYMLGSSLPYTTAGQINQNQLALLNQANTYGQGAAAIPQMQAQDQLTYLQQAQAAQQAQTNAQLQQARDEFSQAQGVGQDIAGLATAGMSMGSGFMGGMGGMGNMMGGGGGGMMNTPWGQQPMMWGGGGGGGGGGGQWGGYNPYAWGGGSPFGQFGYQMGNLARGWGQGG